MNSRLFRFHNVLVIAASWQAYATASAGELSVVSVEPAARSLQAEITDPIVIRFDRPVNPSSFVTMESFWAFGMWSGSVAGGIAFSDGNQTVTLTPARPMSSGEKVMVILSHDLQAQDGSFLRDGGYSYQFWTRSAPADLNLTEIQTLTTNGEGVSTRPYGGVATDFNGDGWLDISMVNEEDTFDVRVFLNQATGDGTFAPFLEPTAPVGERASPSEPSDFNRDGLADLAVVNIDTNNVSILLGNGDGTFAPQQSVGVGQAPRGIAVLDCDGDGDVDIVNTNSGSSNLSILINDGTGVFSAPTFFEAGTNGEWALASADMDSDGLLDLVVGSRAAQQMVVQRGNGDGTFSLASTQSSGGLVWMHVTGDVNGDGHDDVAGVNSNSNSGSILLGDGAGNLAPPQIYFPDSFPLASDLGDIDGDGDLDWVTSSFGGDWQLFLNDGTGVYSFDREFDAPAAASCALFFDIDNDRDLDLGLVDEIADIVVVMSNGGATPAIPAMGSWGMLIMALLVVGAATLALGRRGRIV